MGIKTYLTLIPKFLRMYQRENIIAFASASPRRPARGGNPPEADILAPTSVGTLRLLPHHFHRVYLTIGLRPVGQKNPLKYSILGSIRGIYE
jgi:hypothetical protein